MLAGRSRTTVAEETVRNQRKTCTYRREQPQHDPVTHEETQINTTMPYSLLLSAHILDRDRSDPRRTAVWHVSRCHVACAPQRKTEFEHAA